jgi:hypothetical protein
VLREGGEDGCIGKRLGEWVGWGGEGGCAVGVARRDEE